MHRQTKMPLPQRFEWDVTPAQVIGRPQDPIRRVDQPGCPQADPKRSGVIRRGVIGQRLIDQGFRLRDHGVRIVIDQGDLALPARLRDEISEQHQDRIAGEFDTDRAPARRIEFEQRPRSPAVRGAGPGFVNQIRRDQFIDLAGDRAAREPDARGQIGA